jgi:hypothetical protein
MSYYVRILGTRDPDIHLDDLRTVLEIRNVCASFVVDPSETEEKWAAIEVANSSGDMLMQIERNPVVHGELGQEELDEMRDEIADCYPKSAVKWLSKFFDNVKVIYAFQLLNAATDDDNYPIVDAVRTAIWNQTRGIMQADGEGFTNEEGYHILWQFHDGVTGEWNMAVRNFFGQWTRFTMDLGDNLQRKEFLNGKVPKGAVKS